jgi:hypothetical protein
MAYKLAGRWAVTGEAPSHYVIWSGDVPRTYRIENQGQSIVHVFTMERNADGSLKPEMIGPLPGGSSCEVRAKSLYVAYRDSEPMTQPPVQGVYYWIEDEEVGEYEP